MTRLLRIFGAAALALAVSGGPAAAAAAVGIFEDHRDVGIVLHPGAVVLDEAARAYTVAGSGANMWAREDAFHFAWKKATGDLALAADVAFVGAGTDPHRKACLI